MKHTKNILIYILILGAIIAIILFDAHLIRGLKSDDLLKQADEDTQEICVSVKLIPGNDTQVELYNKDV